MPISDQSVEGNTEKGASLKRRTLFSRLCTLRALDAAFQRVARNRKSQGGVDDISVAAFKADAPELLRALRNQLKRGAFSFSPLRRVPIPKKGGTGFRPILVPTVADRIVQRAILHQICEPLKEHVSHRSSHAFRSDFGVRSAVYQLADELRKGKSSILVVDIENFFPSIDEVRLYDELMSVLPDDSLNALLRMLQRWEMNDLSTIPSHKRDCFPQAGKGVPQGSALSPLLSNFFLRELDRDQSRFMAIRYADDIAVPCSTREEAEAAFAWLQGHMNAFGLRIHPIGHKKSRLYELGNGSPNGLEYLGFYLWRDSRGVNIKPTKASFDNAQNEIEETFDTDSDATLAERYSRLTYFLNSWLGTYGYVCSVKRERQKLLIHSHQALSRLLIDRHLLPSNSGLTTEQRRFLGIDSIFEKAGSRRAEVRRQKSSRQR